MGKFDRIIWIVLDSVGHRPAAPTLPTMATTGPHHARPTSPNTAPLRIPHARRNWGLANIAPAQESFVRGRSQSFPTAKGATHSPGKRHHHGTLGNGPAVWLDQGLSPFTITVFPAGDYRAIRKNRSAVKNARQTKPASGTEILKELGEETRPHRASPIVYTSGDSVFSDCRARKCNSRPRALPHVRNRQKNFSTASIAFGRVIARPL